MLLRIDGCRIELTDREAETLRLVATGKQNKEIAEVLNISIKTVQKHRQSVLDKTGIHDVIALAHFALSRGLVQNLFAYNQNEGQR